MEVKLLRRKERRRRKKKRRRERKERSRERKIRRRRRKKRKKVLRRSPRRRSSLSLSSLLALHLMIWSLYLCGMVLLMARSKLVLKELPLLIKMFSM